MDNWLGGANYHYCALYPPEFRTQYDGWWTARTDNPSPELTSLILRVCACSLLYIIDGSVKERLESELRADSMTLAIRLHEAAEALGASIPPGKGGLIHVQQLFLTAFWYKSAEKWTEAWHALSSAIGAAYEIGLHQDSASEGMSEFDREMRRRLWCVLYLWDFALSSMLSRPTLINRVDCTFEMPTLALEINPGQPYQPSPFRHMKLHCQMCRSMADEMASVPSDRAATELAPRLRRAVDKWFAALPAEYAVENPNTRWDAEYDWVVFQRHYLHLVGYMCLFSPLKSYVTRSSAKPMTEEETELRAAGVQAGLDLMDVSWSFFENLASMGAKFHYAVFCIFDTTTVLCSAFVHDEARNLPQRETILEAIKKGLHMLQELRSVSKTTSDLCRILKSLLVNLPLSSKEKGLIGIAKRTKRAKPPPIGETASTSNAANAANRAQSNSPLTTAETAWEMGSPNSGSGSGVSVAISPAEIDDGDVQPVPAPSLSSHSALGTSSPYHTATSSSASSYQHDGAPPPTILSTVDEFPQLAAVHDGHLSPHEMLPHNCVAPHHDPIYSSFQVPHFNMPPIHQEQWHTSVGAVGGMQGSIQTFQDGHGHGHGHGQSHLEGYDPNMPTVLEYWDWQGLDLGNPNFWGNTHPPPPPPPPPGHM